MKIFWQTVFAFVVVMLMVGPFGHYLSLTSGSPDLAVLGVWILSWFFNREAGVRFALITGVIFDLILAPGIPVWSLSLVGGALLMDALKQRFLDVSSLFHAWLALSIMTALIIIFRMIVYQTFEVSNSVLSLITTSILGLLVYYGVAIRWRLFQRWAGRRL